MKINKDDKGNSKDEGFVCFVDATAAEEAVKQMNRKPLGNDKFLIVQRHIKRQENEMTKGGHHISLID